TAAAQAFAGSAFVSPPSSVLPPSSGLSFLWRRVDAVSPLESSPGGVVPSGLFFVQPAKPIESANARVGRATRCFTEEVSLGLRRTVPQIESAASTLGLLYERRPALSRSHLRDVPAVQWSSGITSSTASGSTRKVRAPDERGFCPVANPCSAS